MGKKELVGNRQYTDEFNVEAIRLGESIWMSFFSNRFSRLGIRWSQGLRETMT